MIRKSAPAPTRTIEEPLSVRPALDSAEFRQLFREHAPFVWRVLRRHGVLQSDLEDVCQEVFMVVHRRLPEFEGRSSLRTWLYEIARRSAMAQRRKRATHVPLEDGLEPPDDRAPGAAEQLEQQQALRWLWRALAQLDDDKREAFVLYELEDMTLAEVSDAVGAPINTVHYRLQAAHQLLKGLAVREDGAAYRKPGLPAAPRERAR